MQRLATDNETVNTAKLHTKRATAVGKHEVYLGVTHVHGSLAAIFGYLPAILRLSSEIWGISSGYLRLSCGYLPAISRLSSTFLGYLAAIFRLSSVFLGFLPAISWLSSCLISFLPFKSIKHYNGMNMFLLSTFDPAGKLRRANKSSKQKQV